MKKFLYGFVLLIGILLAAAIAVCIPGYGIHYITGMKLGDSILGGLLLYIGIGATIFFSYILEDTLGESLKAEYRHWKRKRDGKKEPNEKIPEPQEPPFNKSLEEVLKESK